MSWVCFSHFLEASYIGISVGICAFPLPPAKSWAELQVLKLSEATKRPEGWNPRSPDSYGMRDACKKLQETTYFRKHDNVGLIMSLNKLSHFCTSWWNYMLRNGRPVAQIHPKTSSKNHSRWVCLKITSPPPNWRLISWSSSFVMF